MIPIDEIDRLDVVRSGSVGEREFCDIVLHAKAGHRYTLAQWLDSEHQARRIISAIEERIGMRGERE
ncbi:MAG: hypothetical protein IT368_02805 [Candidatus Hydrogenedentes bacterium]|nr:hypothetical protein [Candidatus Hydrogenedentota bacterium]